MGAKPKVNYQKASGTIHEVKKAVSGNFDALKSGEQALKFD